ncbi:MAG: glycoside hydrolase family 9 protein, partial [Oscillospiraceae bacterium]|nr:glycoside hydrolase family 9 protein [Oscillospiraceae bacterium]
MKKKILAGIASLVMCAATLTAPVQSIAPLTASAAEEVNYAEALQKSMFFYEVQQCGELPDWNMVSWRADSMETDVVPGGWFDAGDHLKITHTNAYTSAILAWGMIEYGDAVKEAGLYDLYMNNLQWGLDYVAAADRGDKVIGLIADDAFDHVWWGSAEVYMRKFKLKGGDDVRPYDEITCTSTVAQMAAAMAAGSIAFKDKDPDRAADYLKHAESLFKLADTTRSNEDQGQTGKGDYYKCSDFYDDLFYAANWMYKATGEQKYLDLCEKDYIPEFPLENQSSDRKFTWGFCWDDASQAAALLYAQNTGKAEWIDQVYRHLEYWTTGYGGKRVDYTPDGMAWLFQWGSARHVTTTCWLAKLACDTIFADDAAKSDKYNKWVDEQLAYCFGDNDLGMSYVLGMGDKNPNTFHHRTASGVWDDKWTGLGDESSDEYKEYAHVLYGALEGGPNQDGSFTDKVGSYQNTEVAIDYNAGYTACLCAMIADKGGKALTDFPPEETPKWEEFKMRASINQAATSYTEIKAFAMNHTAWPTRVIKDLSYNYYFDISEIEAQGGSIDDVEVRIGYDQHSSDEGIMSISKPIKYEGDVDGSVYYVKLSFGDGRVVMPTGQSEHKSECQFRISVPDNKGFTWDSTNDYSFQDLKQGGEMDMVDTPYITMYDGDTLIWGIEPDGTVPVKQPNVNPTPPTTEDTTETAPIIGGDTVYG